MKKILFSISIIFFQLNLLFAAPINDNCSGAISLPINDDCITTTGDVTNATQSLAGCQGTANDDVWFSFVATKTSVNISVVGSASFNPVFETFSGDCNNLISTGCVDDNYGNGTSENVILSNLTPGNTYYIRVYHYSASVASTKTFTICLQNLQIIPSCITAQPAADDCDILTTPTICNFNGYCGNTYNKSATHPNGYTKNTWPELATAFAGANIDNNSFITFVANSTTISFYIWIYNSKNNYGIQMMVADIPTCGSGTVTSVYVNNNMLPTGQINYNTVTASGLIIGKKYYIMIDGYAGDECEYTVGIPKNSTGFSVSASVSPSIQTICTGSSLNLKATGGNGTYTWTTANMSELSATSGSTVTVTPTSNGLTKYIVSSPSTNPNCPNNSDTAKITVQAPTILSAIAGSPNLCLNSPITFSNTISGGIWNSDNTNIATINPVTGLVTGVSPGTAKITYSLTVNGCSSVPVELNITVGNSMNFTPSISTQPTTCNGADGVIKLSGLSPSKQYDITYTFVGSTSLSGLTTDNNGELLISNLAIGTYSNFTVSSGGCSGTNSTSLTLVAPNTPKVTITAPTNACIDDIISITATPDVPNGTYLWNTGETTPTIQVSLAQLPSVNYSVVYTANGCKSDVNNGGTITINTFKKPIATFEASTIKGCAPLDVQFINTSTTNGSTALWNLGDGNTSNVLTSFTHRFNNSGKKDISLTLSNPGCSSDPLIINEMIEILPKVEAKIKVNTYKNYTTSPLITFSNISKNSTNIIWDFGDLTYSTDSLIEHKYPEIENEYIIKLTANNENYCSDSATVKIKIVEELLYYIPTAFTPNGVGVETNEIFKPILSGVDEATYSFNIFNKWGEVVFSTNDIEKGWDGKYKGQSLSNGLFNWVIEFMDTENQIRHIKSGYVTLLK